MNSSNEPRQSKRSIEIIPREPKPEQITAVIDSREQMPLDLSPLRTTSGTLPTGDYTVLGLEKVIAVERKSESDLLSCVGSDRERFDREVQRLLAYQVRALVIESTWSRLETGDWRSRVVPAAVIGSLLSWVSQGLPVIMADDHAKAGEYVSRLLFIAARHRWREIRSLVVGSIGESR